MTQSTPTDLGDAHRFDGGAVADELEVRPGHGLGDAQAATRTVDFGRNELAEAARTPVSHTNTNPAPTTPTQEDKP